MGLWGQLATYPRLLMAGQPTKLDIFMLLGGTICAIASGIPFPLIGILFGQLLNDFNEVSCNSPDEDSEDPSSYQGQINNRILVIFYLAIAQFVLIYAHLLLFTLFGSRLTLRLREKYLESLLRQEPSYFDKVTSGEVASRLTADCQTIRSGTSEKVGICLASLSFFVASYVVAFIKDSTLAAILISLVPAYFLMTFVGSHYIEKYAGLMSDHAASAAEIASEALRNLVVVHAFGAEGKLEEKFSSVLSASKREGLKKALAIGIQSGILYFVAYAANGLAFWQGSKRVAKQAEFQSGGTTVGATFTVIFILVEATLLLSQVAPFIHLFSAAAASYDKLSSELNRDSEIDGTTAFGKRMNNSEGLIEFENVSFCYPARPDVKVLDNINIRVQPLKHTAIVGLSGSGKSTIASLATRLYDTSAGKVLYDGHDVRELNTADLRSQISLVQQEPCLLDRSVLENIAYGLTNSDKTEHANLKQILGGSDLAAFAESLRGGQSLATAISQTNSELATIGHLVTEAAVLADVDEFITQLPQGYGTIVGSSGRLFSGGQKQRIALARAIVKNPKVLILDEATAALDSKSEQRIQRALENVGKSRTVLTIAHRLSTIKNADRIIVLQKGSVMEEGSHLDLISVDGYYANMVRLQNSGGSNFARSLQEDGVVTDNVSTISREGDDTLAEKQQVLATDNEKESPPPTPSEGGSIDNGAAEEEEEAPEPPPKTIFQLMRGYFPAVRPHLLTISLALLASVIVGGSFSGEAVIFGNTVGSLNLCKSASSIISNGEFFGLMFFVLAIIELFANIVSWTGFGIVSEKVVYTVRVLSFRSLFQQDLAWHQSENRTPSKLLAYITRDGAALAGLSGSVIGTLFSISVNLFAAIILTTVIAWKISLVCLALVPLSLGAGVLELHILGKFEERHESAYTKSVDIGTEAIHSIKTIASLSLEKTTLQAYKDSLEGPRRETFQVTWQASLCQAVTYFLGNCVNALAYWWGSKQIIAGNYTQVQFLIVVFSLLVSAMLWSQMFALAPELSSARASMARILGLVEIGKDKMKGHVVRSSALALSNEKDVEAEAELSSPSLARGASRVEFRDVHFSYPARPDLEVLTGLDLNIPAGKFCALVGPSGAGKSTIMSLVERFYSPQSGAIIVDNEDITKQASSSFRDKMGLVPQESVLFDGTVEFNVGLGARSGQNATLEDIQEACKLANIHDVITSLPDGYDTLCGANGNQFSGGQRQRLSIARALVRKPKLLILDEPTSALDAESEKLLQDGLDRAAEGITVIAIAHRLHTIRRAHKIFLIEGGKCVDSGTHDELFTRSKSYKENVLHQTIE